MADFTIYILSFVLLGGALAAWYITKDTPMGRTVTMVSLVIVALVFILISFKGKIPFISSIMDWFRNRDIDKKIEVLDKDIKRLRKEKKEGIKSADKLEAEAIALAKKADHYVKSVRVMDNIIKDQTEAANKALDPTKVGLESVPEKLEDAEKEAASLLRALKQRNKARRGS